jgi:hypothetical protein
MSYRRRIVVTGVALGWVALAFWMGGRGAARPAAAPQGKEKGGPTRSYLGAMTCGGARCHDSKPDPNEELVCLCTEFKTWSEEDRHKIAYRVLLLTDRAKEMGKLLPNKVPVFENEACLSCHSVVDAKIDKGFPRDEGVTCVVCHGPYEEWVNLHYQRVKPEKWRDLPPEEKQQRFGMTDLSTPIKRATLCASCHVGDLNPNKPAKFVTHEMYAAGHPPLPGFEAATFSDQMPKHWKYLREKPKKIQKILHYDGVDEERTKFILVNAAVSLGESMRLIKCQAVDCAKDPDPDKRTLDFANFDCYACHHDLKSPSWRQARVNAGKPGRVPMRPWPSALVRLAVGHAADDDAEAKRLDGEFAAKWRRLQAAFEDRPFGDPEKIALAANDLERWADALAGKLDKKPCDEAAARKLQARLPSLFDGETPDYDSARQIAWAFDVMYQELQTPPRKPDPRIEEVVKSLRNDLKLDLPSGQKHSISEELSDGLKRRNSYNPDEFKKALATLSALVGGK